MAPSWFKLVLVVVLIFVLFGRGKISEFMGDFAKGIKSFKRGLSEDPNEPAAPKGIDDSPATRVEARASSPREDLRV
jgi:sec-independent protein translocase protein TatA